MVSFIFNAHSIQQEMWSRAFLPSFLFALIQNDFVLYLFTIFLQVWLYYFSISPLCLPLCVSIFLICNCVTVSVSNSLTLFNRWMDSFGNDVIYFSTDFYYLFNNARLTGPAETGLEKIYQHRAISNWIETYFTFF